MRVWSLDSKYFLCMSHQIIDITTLTTLLLAGAKDIEKTQPRRSRKQLKEGVFDWDAITPWKLDFHETDKKFWEWEQKWRTFSNLSGQILPSKGPFKIKITHIFDKSFASVVNHIFDGGSFRSEISTGLQYIVWSRVNKMREAFNDLKEACFLFWSALHFSGLDVTFDVISELHEHDEEYRMSVLRTYFSDDVLQLIETFNLPPHQVIRLFLFPPVNNRCRL